MTHAEAPGRREVALLAGVLAVVLGLRLPFLGHTSLWLDEMWSIATARMSWPALGWVVLHQDSNASLYYALLHGWLQLDPSVAGARLPSVLAAMATALVLYALGRRLAGARVGLVAALLLAVNAFNVQVSQQARSYGLVVLLATLSTYLFVRSVEEPARRRWLGYVLVSALAVYAHVFALLVLAAQWASLPSLRRRDLPFGPLLASGAGVGLLVLPVPILLRLRMDDPMPPLAWVPKLSPAVVKELLRRLSGSTDFAPAWLSRPLFACYLVLCLAALLGAVREWRSSGRSREAWYLTLPLTWLLVPIAATGAVSIFKPMLVAKFLLVCQPALALLAAMGLSFIRRGWARMAALAAVVGISLLGLPDYYRFRARNLEWPAATAHILGRAAPGDAAIFFVAPGWLLFDHYRATRADQGPTIDVVYPEHRGRDDPRSLVYAPPVRGDLVDRLGTGSHRVWLVLFHDQFQFTAGLSQRLQETLASTHVKVDEAQFEGDGERVMVLLYEPGTKVERREAGGTSLR